MFCTLIKPNTSFFATIQNTILSTFVHTNKLDKGHLGDYNLNITQTHKMNSLFIYT
jgi:hypothetical protein